jgi:hypothetical protein
VLDAGVAGAATAGAVVAAAAGAAGAAGGAGLHAVNTNIPTIMSGMIVASFRFIDIFSSMSSQGYINNQQ